MAVNLERILGQTRKLIALAVNNPSEEEARSAARKACTLIVTHGFTLDIGEIDEETVTDQAPAATGYTDLPPTWDAGLEIIAQMAASGQYAWAAETLGGIRAWVHQHRHMTPKQWQAIQNIRSAR